MVYKLYFRNDVLKKNPCPRLHKQQSRGLVVASLRAVLAFVLVCGISPADRQLFENGARLYIFVTPSLCSQQICGTELIVHHIIMGLFCTRRNNVGLLFLQKLLRVLSHEGQIVHQRHAAQRTM